jgi:O-antigen ligase
MAETASTPWWESKLARRLDVLAAIAAMVVVCRVALQENLSWVAWAMTAAAFLILVAVRWPYGAVLALIGSSAMPRFFVELSGWKARPEHFAVAIVFVAVVIWVSAYKRQIRIEKLDYCILVYIALNYVSSAVTSLGPSDTLRWALLHNLAVLPYFLIRVLLQDRQTLERAFRILLAVGVIESAYGIFCYASHHAFGTTGGMEIGAYLVDVAAPYGSLYEPNLFGAYTACCGVVFLAMYMIEGHRFVHLVGFLVTSLATTLSFSRAALLAFVVVIVWVLWKADDPVKSRRSKPAIFALGVGLVLLIAVATVGGVLKERFTNLFQQGLAEETAVTRLIVTAEALQEIPKHPLLGSGTASFNLSFDWAQYVPEWEGNARWIGNAPLRILHDTGLFGLAALLSFFILVWWKIRRGLRARNSPVAMLLGLSAGTLIYSISFQSTDGSNLAFFWVQLGFLASAAVLINGSASSANGMGTGGAEQRST